MSFELFSRPDTNRSLPNNESDEMPEGLYARAHFTPDVIATQGEDSITFEVALPDVDAQDIDLAFVGDTLTLRTFGHVANATGVVSPKRRYFRRFGIPFKPDRDRISADFEHGKLTVRVPFEAREKLQHLAIHDRDHE